MSPESIALIWGAVALGAGTFAARVVGPLLGAQVRVPPAFTDLMARASVVLLVALCAVAALVEDGGFAGWARTIAVLVAGVLAWRRAPFVVVVLAAAGAAAGLRLLGVE